MAEISGKVSPLEHFPLIQSGLDVQKRHKHACNTISGVLVPDEMRKVPEFEACPEQATIFQWFRSQRAEIQVLDEFQAVLWRGVWYDILVTGAMIPNCRQSGSVASFGGHVRWHKWHTKLRQISQTLEAQKKAN